MFYVRWGLMKQNEGNLKHNKFPPRGKRETRTCSYRKSQLEIMGMKNIVVDIKNWKDELNIKKNIT